MSIRLNALIMSPRHAARFLTVNDWREIREVYQRSTYMLLQLRIG